MKNLKRIDLHQNKIYKFSYNPDYIPNLKYINFSDNYFSSPFFTLINPSARFVSKAKQWWAY